MRRSLVALLFTCAIPALASAQVEGTTSPTFHPGQWAAQFAVGGGFSGLGAMRFSTPTKAWTFMAIVNGTFSHVTSTGEEGTFQNLSLRVGRRSFRPGTGRIRPFAELGGSGSLGRNHLSGAGPATTNLVYGAGVYGKLGATIFFAPELSLGAGWTAGVNLFREDFHQSGSPTEHITSLDFAAGGISLEGAFYF